MSLIPLQGVKAGYSKFIRVLILEAKDLSFRSDGAQPILVRGLDLKYKEKSLTSLKLKIENGQVRSITNGSYGRSAKKPIKSDLRIRSRDPRGIWLGTRRYAGELRVFQDGNKFKVVNHLPIEKYLKSVVGAEVPKSWPSEALKAQAIAARTYAVNQIKSQNKFDIGSSISNQVYLGLESETPSIAKAVDATNSLVLVHNGNLIQAVFHSSSGGKTENSGSVWKHQKPYLVSVKDYDQNSPNFEWKKSIKPEELYSIFYKIGGVNAIRVTKLTSTNRILEVLVYGPKGKAYLTGKELRKKLNLKSTMLKFDMVPYMPENIIKDNSSLLLSSEKANKSKRDKFPLPLPPLTNNSAYGYPKLPFLPSRYSLLISGFGSGHGVGMSQWGAYGMAIEGASYQRILQHYYKGVRIKNYSYLYN
ncbi:MULTISPECIES: SpoIID/LytB domain-containing protein [Prochlorococcus]|uniref:SpoIID/LytB domain-containing protein n=1 Tax=Prochlorococcus TaxID=1218 RepID=UPI0005338EF7|nr:MULTISPECIES: SpoIID/LytB domain-containing protein [Prochlorococcus]KGG11925.1 putative sporulation protein SpoIID [Prochlorococcus sp. MIT 0601]